MSRNSHVVWGFILVFALLMLLTPVLNAQVLEKLPYSGAVLTARAIRAGRIQLHPTNPSNEVNPDLTCSPAPCAFPNVNASEGTSNPVNEHPIAVNPNNPLQLLTGGNDYNCGNLQGYFASGDGGTTWTRVCSPGGGGQGDPVVAYDLNNIAYAGGIQSGRIVDFISTDNGMHWGSPITVIGAQLGYLADKPWMEADLTPLSPFANSLYVSTTQFATNSDSQIWVSHSIDGGHTWASTAVAPRQHYPTSVDQFSDLAVGTDGTVYVTWMRCPANGPTGDCGGTTAKMLLSKSTDGGTTWTPEVTVASVKMVPDTCGAFYGCLPNTSERVSNIPSNAAIGSGSTAKVYVAMYSWSGTQMQVQVAVSTDGGATFGAPVRVTTSNTGDQFFQWVNLAKNGTVGVTWLDRRADPANLKYKPAFAFSNNSGATYSFTKFLSTTQSNPLNDGFGGGFMGDYRTHVWQRKAIYADWPDMRTGTSQDEVGGAQFP